MQRKRGEWVPIGETLADLGWPGEAYPRRHAPSAALPHRCRSGRPTCWSQRSNPGQRLPGANNGIVQFAPH